MKKIIIGMVIVSLTLAILGKSADVLSADFTGTKIDNVYQIVTKLGCHTTIELPQGKKIKHFIIGDQKLWKAESDGKYAFIKPIQAGIETTMTVITTDENMFQFTAAEESAIGESDFHKKVKIIFRDDEPLIAPIIASRSNEPEMNIEEIQRNIERKLAGQKTAMLKTLDYKFSIKKNVFKILNVFQDGIFTYIDLSHTQVRPAVFLVNSNDKTKLEPVNFTDQDGLFTIHRILGKDEFFLLKNGKEYSKIYKK